jgi:hypothetical protein
MVKSVYAEDAAKRAKFERWHVSTAAVQAGWLPGFAKRARRAGYWSPLAE